MRHRLDLPCSVVGLALTWLAITADAAPAPDPVAADFRPLLYAAEGAKKIVEFAKDGSVAWECPAEMSRDAWKLPNGNFLVAEESARAVREYAPDGALVREIRVGFAPYSAVRLPDGNTLACGQQSMLEVDPAGKEVWSLAGSDIPAMGVRWFAGVQVLPGGSVFVCNAGGKVPFFEVTREKKVAWQCDPAKTPIPLGHGVQRLDIPGTPVR